MKFLLSYSGLLLLFLIISNETFSQGFEKCWSGKYYEQYVKLHPEVADQRRKMLEEISKIKPEDGSRSALRIIPVVFHVIHQGGAENISRAQLLDQLRILNEDFRRLNADTSSTPAAFQGVAVDCNIEFRLAQKDTNGNCTDGIVRIYSYLTNHVFGDTRVKELYGWNHLKYLNIFTVKNITDAFTGGTTLGYAPIPPAGFHPELDGVIMRSDCVGSIGTAASGSFFMQAGRSVTHEVGHWLGLSHIWGDAFCGDDNIADTPPAEDANMNCPIFPWHANNSCGAGANGEMFCNYMDYSDGNCCNMFTYEQQSLMNDYTLQGIRTIIYTPANLTATGTDGTPPSPCKPMADFAASITSICAGSAITYSGYPYNTDTITSYSWLFPGGTPSSSSAVSPAVTYSTPGVYNVTLTLSNSSGNDTKVRSQYIHVYGGAVYTAPYSNSFESAAEFQQLDSRVINDDGGNTWQRVTNAASNGSSSIKIDNFSGNHINEIDAYIPTSFNFTYVTQPVLTFKVAYAQRNSVSDEYLKVFVSSNCGRTWQQRFGKHGSALATAPVTTTNFTPSSSQWRAETVNLTPFQNMPNVRFKFESTSTEGNNVFIDDINVTGIVGIEENDFNISSFILFPNPSTGNVSLLFNLIRETEVQIVFTDALGKQVLSREKNKYPAGENSIVIENEFENGIYFVQIRTGNSVQARRLVMIKN